MLELSNVQGRAWDDVDVSSSRPCPEIDDEYLSKISERLMHPFTSIDVP